MDAQDGREPLLAQEGAMSKGAKRAIPHEHVPRAQGGMERRHLGHVVGVPGRDEHLQQETRAGMQQSEQVGHGESTPRALSAGVAKILWQYWHLGPRETGPIDQEGPVAPPPPLIVGRLLADGGRPTQQLLPDDKRQPGTGLTKRGGGKTWRSHMGQVATRGVPMEDWQEEERNGGDRVEVAYPPLLAHLATESENHGGVQQSRKLGFDVSACFQYCADHADPPLCERL